MSWANIKLIWARELKDQLRDRRTLFTVVVLPLLLYPFMGISLIQVTQFFREHPTKVWIIGADNLPKAPDLFEGDVISPNFQSKSESKFLEVCRFPENEADILRIVEQFKNDLPPTKAGELVDAFIQQQMTDCNVDLAIVVPRKIDVVDEVAGNETNVFLFVNSASDKSRIALERTEAVLRQWQEAVIGERLKKHQLSLESANPIQVKRADVANKRERQAAAWSKTLPLLIMIWCLTGAFYPAVDLCAGEKERGTFETLLSSPANRSEIALGKLLTVMAFSISTATLNLLSMGFTSVFVLSRMGQFPGGGLISSLGPPPVASVFWLALASIPVAALFSAVSLAAAAFARSSKEGQYYLVPLIMISMPLMVIPMLPAAKLDFGTSLIPITNVMLVLRGLIEGNYVDVLPYLSLVILVTMFCVFGAVRWVVHQFNSESVMFRASERFGIGSWIVQTFNERGEMPALGPALLCGVVILLTKFFVGFAASIPNDWGDMARQTITVLIATVAMPAILMALFLTRRPDKALKFRWCPPGFVAAALLLAICFHPAFTVLSKTVLYIYPPGEGLQSMTSMLSSAFDQAPSIWFMIALFAIAPALLEEVAFRGFILSGTQAVKNPWIAVGISSLFFGAAHAVFQQSVIAFCVGMLLGYLAIRTESLLPCIAFHATHNSLTVVSSQISQLGIADSFTWLAKVGESGSLEYNLYPGTMMTLMGLAIMIWLTQKTSLTKRQTDVDCDWIFGLLKSWFRNPWLVGSK